MPYGYADGSVALRTGRPLNPIGAFSGSPEPRGPPSGSTGQRIARSPSSPCPEGQICVNDLCSTAADAASIPPDAAVAGDGATSEDMSQSPAPDMTAVPGCRLGNGGRIATLAECDSVPQFYAANQSAFWGAFPADEIQCLAALGNQLLYGCGSAGRVGTKKCGGLPKVRDVMAGSTWQSTNGSLSAASNSSAAEGVLCCKAGEKAVGCPGAFAAGGASNQCAGGWSVCVTLP